MGVAKVARRCRFSRTYFVRTGGSKTRTLLSRLRYYASGVDAACGPVDALRASVVPHPADLMDSNPDLGGLDASAGAVRLKINGHASQTGVPLGVQ